MRVVFFGTPVFAAHVLEYLLKNQVNIVGVVSKPDRPKGRSSALIPTPVKTVALAYNPSLPLFQPEIVSAPEVADSLRSLQADLFVVVAYGEIIKQHLLEMPFKGCINLHASFLPKYRGAAPIQRCIMDGETQTGVTIIHMVKKMDAGDMIRKVMIPIDPEMTYGELEEALCEVGKKLFFDVIMDFEKGEPSSIPQDLSQVTIAPKIELEDCQISWSRPAHELHNLVRGVNPFPGAWCNVLVKGEKKRLKINRTRIVFSDHCSPATIVNIDQTKGNLIIAAGDHALELLEVQLEGKKSMSSEELTRGISRLQFVF
ncbi:MAG: methionyl-tRNA formyltransferase [Parachlamydiaceae bacterium]